MAIQIRDAHHSEEQAIRNLLLAAFGQAEGPEIAELLSALLRDPSARPLLSLVATSEERVVGHVLFTKARVHGAERGTEAALLAPLAVDPACQKQGIGGRLIADGLKRLKASGIGLVFVLGHPGYYPRHGFQPAAIQGLDAPYPIPAEHADAWMVQALQPHLLGHIHGRVVCADAISDPRYWAE